MKRLLFLFVFIGFAIITIATAAENDSSGFVGTWEGAWNAENSSDRISTAIKIEIDSEGKIFLSSYEAGRSAPWATTPSSTFPPKVVDQKPGILILETSTGATINLRLTTKDMIRGTLTKPGFRTMTATLTRK